MKIPPKFTESSKITRLLDQIEELLTKYNAIKPDDLVLKLKRRASILKSSLYSARIEGNKLDDSSMSSFASLPKSLAKLELSNLVKAIELVHKRTWSDDIELQDLKNLHSLVMKDLYAGAGSLRQEPSAIYNMAGVAVYLCPAVSDVIPLTTELLEYISTKQAYSPLIQVALSHFVFEKIHPFLDGNGRVGRVLIHLLMKKYGYDTLGMLSFEEYIDKNRQDYYDLLGSGSSDISGFVEFILESFVYGLQSGLNSLQELVPISPLIYLMPRRQEILALLTDHPHSSFDFLHRRFFSIPPRTLRYDLKYLCDHGYIIKIGSTNGVLYSPKV
jgi:Fic family protein